MQWPRWDFVVPWAPWMSSDGRWLLTCKAPHTHLPTTTIQLATLQEMRLVQRVSHEGQVNACMLRPIRDLAGLWCLFCLAAGCWHNVP